MRYWYPPSSKPRVLKIPEVVQVTQNESDFDKDVEWYEIEKRAKAVVFSQIGSQYDYRQKSTKIALQALRLCLDIKKFESK